MGTFEAKWEAAYGSFVTINAFCDELSKPSLLDPVEFDVFPASWQEAATRVSA